MVVRWLMTLRLSFNSCARTCASRAALVSLRHTVHPADDEDAPAKRRISQSFVQALAILVAQTNLIVVNRLTLSDQIYIRGVLNRIRENADTDEQGDIEVAERVVVVHNFRDYSSTEDVEKCIQTDIVDGFGATKSTFKLHGEERVFWKNQETGLRHVVLGREGFASGDHFNERTLSTLKQWMNDETKRATARTASKVILSRVVGFVNSHLGSFLQAPDPTQRLAVEYAMHPDTKAPVIRTREGVDSVSLRSGLKFDGECFVALNHVVQRFKPLVSVPASEPRIGVDAPTLGASCRLLRCGRPDRWFGQVT